MLLLVQNCLDPSRATEIFSVPKRRIFALPKIVRYRNKSGLQYAVLWQRILACYHALNGLYTLSSDFVQWRQHPLLYDTVHSVIFSKILFDFKKSISGPIKLKFSGKTLNAILLAPIYFWGVYGRSFSFWCAYPAGFGSLKAVTNCFWRRKVGHINGLFVLQNESGR